MFAFVAYLVQLVLIGIGLTVLLIMGTLAYQRFRHTVEMWGQLPAETTDEGRARVEAMKSMFGAHLSRYGHHFFCICVGCPNRVKYRYSNTLCYLHVSEKADWRGSL